jgi:hypothetical protein
MGVVIGRERRRLRMGGNMDEMDEEDEDGDDDETP